MTTTTTPVVRGGAWLTESVDSSTVLTPERLSDEHRMIGQTAEDFIDGEVLPVLEQLEAKDWQLARTLLKRCGDLGLLGTDVPEAFGGVDLDKAASVVVGEAAGRCASFATAFGAQTGLSITPLVCFGTEDQKRRYLPGLVSGDLVGAYALSESGSGSDALSARARAVPQPDGSFLLSGEKMWISNAGFADLFVVFARVVEGDGPGQFTAFLIERAFPGVSCGKEEHKMGLHGSSTTPLILQEVRVPAANVLGHVGKGHKVAFNVLNYGRFKLGAMCSGGARRVIGQAAVYAAERRQFGQPIAAFGAVKHKLAEMVIREYAVEAMLYRTAGLIDAAIDQSRGGSDAAVSALEEFAIEASILKVASSEMIDFVVDENVQIHGGNGFVRDYPAERHYRDARVNRIFEGTNEINRLLIPGILAKRAVKGTLPIIAAARALQDEILSPSFETAGDGPLDGVRKAVTGMKKTALMVLGTAMQTYGARLSDEQEILTRSADVIMDVYAAESVLLRAEAANAPLHAAVAQVFVNDAAGRVELTARDALAAMAEGDSLRVLSAALRRLMKVPAVNTIGLRRTIEAALAERRRYPF